MPVTTTGLAAEYLLREGTGTTAHDTSGHGLDGTVHFANSSSHWDTYGITFGGDGTVNYISLPDTVLANDDTSITDFTVEAWCSPTQRSIPDPAYLVSFASGLFLDQEASTFKGFAEDSTHVLSAASPSFSANPGHWTHLTFIRSGSTLSLRINGTTVVSNTGMPTVPVALSGGAKFIGSADAGYTFYGTIGEVRIYNRALTDTEDTDNYNATISNYPAPVDPPVINSFSVSPGTIPTPGSVTLSWGVSGATTVSINNGVGTVAATGSTTVSISVDTVFTLTATNTGGSRSAAADAFVTSSEPPSINSFTSDVSTVSPGGTVTLSWDVSNVDTVSINNGIGTVADTGSITVTLSRTATFILTATNTHGSRTHRVDVTVAGLQLTSFTASQTTVDSGDSVTLSWTVTGNPTQFYINGVYAGNDTASSFVVAPTTTQAYTLVAIGVDGNATLSASRTLTITVTGTSAPAGAPVIVFFLASPNAGHATSSGFQTGFATQFQWYVTGADSIYIDNGVGDVSTGLTRDWFVTQNATYTLTARNAAGATTATAPVAIVPDGVSIPTITSFTGLPDTGGKIRFNWITSNASSVSIDHGVGSELASSTTIATPTTGLYTLTASNDYASQQASVAVTVGTSNGGRPGVNLLTASPGYFDPFTIPTGAPGKTVRIYWQVSGATSVYLINSATMTQVDASQGFVDVEVFGTTTFVLRAINGSGVTYSAVTVLVSRWIIWVPGQTGDGTAPPYALASLTTSHKPDAKLVAFGGGFGFNDTVGYFSGSPSWDHEGTPWNKRTDFQYHAGIDDGSLNAVDVIHRDITSVNQRQGSYDFIHSGLNDGSLYLLILEYHEGNYPFDPAFGPPYDDQFWIYDTYIFEQLPDGSSNMWLPAGYVYQLSTGFNSSNNEGTVAGYVQNLDNVLDGDPNTYGVLQASDYYPGFVTGTAMSINSWSSIHFPAPIPPPLVPLGSGGGGGGLGNQPTRYCIMFDTLSGLHLPTTLTGSIIS